MGCECVSAKCGLEYNVDNVRIYAFHAADSSALTEAAQGHATDQVLNTKSRSIIAQHILLFLELSQSLSLFARKTAWRDAVSRPLDLSKPGCPIHVGVIRHTMGG